MRSLIRQGAVVTGDRWVRHTAGDGVQHGDRPQLYTLAEWRLARQAPGERSVRCGVWLEPADDPAALAPDLGRLALIAVHFPSFTDGRGYTIARLLRERYGYRGELRACGPLTRDLLYYLARCGFDAYELREGEDAQAALAELHAFDEVYQAAADRGPLFERRFGRAPVPTTQLA